MDAMTGTTAITNRKLLIDLIHEEAAKPACCFTIGHTVEENFTLEIGHPLSGSIAALILGEDHYVPRDLREGCLYKKAKDGAIVRRAEVGYYMTGTGKKVPTLRRLQGETPKSALAVVRFGLPEGALLRGGLEPLRSGVSGGNVVAKSKTHALVEVKEGETLTIFYPDGAVCILSYDDMRNLASVGGNLTMLEPSEAFDVRFTENVVIAGRSIGTEKPATPQSEDYALHELAAMIRLTRYYPDMLQPIINEIAQRAKGVGLRDEVRHHLRRSLRSIGNTHDFWWLTDQGAKNAEPWKPRQRGNPSPLRTGRKAMTHDERLAYEHRRNERRSELHKNQPTKGAGGTADPHGKGKKGKSKK